MTKSRAQQLLEKLQNRDTWNLWEMSNLRQKSTGLPMIIYVSAKQGSHGPRIKVSQDHSEKFNMRNTASVSIADDPKVVVGELSAKDFEAVKRYVLLNKDVLLKFWSGEIDTIELAAELKKV